MSVRTDQVNLIINVNGNAAQNQLNELRKRAADLTFEMKNNLKKGTEEYIAAASELKKVNADMVTLKQQIGITALSQKELTAELNKMKALKGSMTPFTQEFKDMQKQIEAVESRLYDVRNGVTGLASVWSKLGDQVKQFGALAAGYLGFQFLTGQFQNIIQGAGKLSDQLADLRRVSGLTADEVANLSAGLSRLDTRTSTSALRDIAIVAGKLGVAKDDILAFTKAVDMLVVALGDELGDADEITTQLGKILNVFDGKITGENITKLGNAIVDLANKGVATGGFVVDFTQRLSGLAKSANIGLPALLGLGAGLEETGAKVESASTAISKLITNIAQDIPKAAKIAGATTQDEINKFADTFAKKPEEALLQFAQGLQKNKQDFAEIANSFKDAGESGARVITTLATLGTKTDFFREKMNEAGVAIKQTNSIQDAFNLKNETLGASLDKLGKEFFKFIMTSGISDFLKGAVQNTIDFIQWIKQIPDFIQRFRITLSLLATAFIVLNRQLIIANVQWLLNKAAIIAETVAVGAAATATLVYRAALFALAIAQAAVTGNITKAREAWILLNAAFKASPIGALITLVVGLGLALDSLISKIGTMQKAQQDLAKKSIDNYSDQVNKIEQLKKALESETTSYQQKKAILQQLIDINPEFAETLRLDAEGHLYGASSIDAYIAALKRKGEAEAAQELSNEQNKKILALQQERAEWEKSEKFSAQARQKMIADLDTQIAKIQQVKDFYDKKVIGNITSTNEFLQPGDTVVGSKKQTKEDPSVAARRAELNKMIEDSKAAYEKLNKNDDAGQRANLALRAKYQAELDALDHKQSKVGGSKNSEYERLKKEAAEFYKSLQKLKEDAANADKSQDEKELIALQQKYDALHAKALEYFKKNVIDRKTYNAEEKIIIETFQKELATLQQKQFGAHSDEEYARALKDTQDYFDEQRNIEGNRYAEGKQTKAQYDAEIHALDLDEKAQLIEVAHDYSATVKKAGEDETRFKKDQEKLQTADAIAGAEARKKIAEQEAIAKAKLAVLKAPNGSKDQQAAQKKLLQVQFDQATAEMDKRSEVYLEAEAELQAQMQQVDADYNQQRIQNWSDVGQQLVSITDNLFQALNNIDQRALQKEQKVNDAKKASYKKQLDDKLISQKQYDKKVAEADAEMDKKKAALALAQAKRQKAQQLFAAITNTASAVAGALGSPPVGPWNIALAALMGALGLVQITAIATQPLPDSSTASFGQGGLLDKGPYHKDKEKGLHVVDPLTGKTEMLLEKDEAVVKGDAIRDKNNYTLSGTPSQITSKLNAMHGGVDWAPGAVINMPAFRKPAAQMKADLPRIMEQGGLIRPMNTRTQDPAAVAAGNLLKQLIEKQDQIVTEIQNLDRELHAVVSIKEYREKEKQYDAAKKAGGLAQ